MKKEYIKPEMRMIQVQAEGFLAMSFNKDAGVTNMYGDSVSDDDDEWSGAW